MALALINEVITPSIGVGRRLITADIPFRAAPAGSTAAIVRRRVPRVMRHERLHHSHRPVSLSSRLQCSTPPPHTSGESTGTQPCRRRRRSDHGTGQVGVGPTAPQAVSHCRPMHSSRNGVQ